MSRFGKCSERLNYLREEIFGLTQGEVAEQLGMTQSNISSVEIGRVQPSLMLVLSFAIACKICPSWLILETDDEPEIMIPTVNDANLNYNPNNILKDSKNIADSIISFLGKRMKIARGNTILSQKELSKIIGIAQSNISSFENGTATPSIEMLANISSALNIHIDWLLAYSKAFITKLIISDIHLPSDDPVRKLVETQLNMLSIKNQISTEKIGTNDVAKNLLGIIDVNTITPQNLRNIAGLLLRLADIIENTSPDIVLRPNVNGHPTNEMVIIEAKNRAHETTENITDNGIIDRHEIQKRRKGMNLDHAFDVEILPKNFRRKKREV